MKGGPAGRVRLHAVRPKLFQIERIDKGIDGTDWVFFIDPVIKALRRKRGFNPICTFHYRFMITPEESSAEFITRQVFSHSQGHLRLC